MDKQEVGDVWGNALHHKDENNLNGIPMQRRELTHTHTRNCYLQRNTTLRKPEQAVVNTVIREQERVLGS